MICIKNSTGKNIGITVVVKICYCNSVLITHNLYVIFKNLRRKPMPDTNTVPFYLFACVMKNHTTISYSPAVLIVNHPDCVDISIYRQIIFNKFFIFINKNTSAVGSKKNFIIQYKKIIYICQTVISKNSINLKILVYSSKKITCKNVQFIIDHLDSLCIISAGDFYPVFIFICKNTFSIQGCPYYRIFIHFNKPE